jgi:starch synthase
MTTGPSWTADVLAVASEIFPLIKTGGLADVAGALPGALATHGVRTRTLIPGYPGVISALERAEPVLAYEALFGGPARLLAAEAAGLALFVLDAPHLFARAGGPYADIQGRDWSDNAQRFAALARVGADIGQGRLAAWSPDIVHAHDWQAGLTAAYLTYDAAPRPGVVMTVHNLAFQGQFDRRLLGALGLPDRAFTQDGVEYYGDIGFLKAGLRLADRLTTVSPTYAAEIRTPEQGMGLDGLLRGRADKLTGIINGIDDATWDPARDPHIAAPFRAGDLAGRALTRADLQRRFGLEPDPQALLVGVVSRLSWQKGLDLLLGALPVLLAEGGQLALLGSGEARLQAGFAAAAAAHPGRIGCAFTYDEALAHAVQAGADAIAVPSRFEPCGLTQLCALRYGAVPLVARVGGLSDTIIDANPMALAAGVATGVQFAPVEAPMLEAALRQTAVLRRDPETWQRLQANGMATDVSWSQPAGRYAALYRGLIAERST